MSPSATPATQKWRGVTGVTAAPKPVQARHPQCTLGRLKKCLLCKGTDAVDLSVTPLSVIEVDGLEGPLSQEEAAQRCGCTIDDLCPGPLAIDAGDKIRTIYDGS